MEEWWPAPTGTTEVKWQRARHRSSVTCTNTYCGHLREIYSRVKEDPVGGPQDPTHQLVCTQPAMAHEDLSFPSGSACELAPHMLRLPMIFELRRLTQNFIHSHYKKKNSNGLVAGRCSNLRVLVTSLVWIGAPFLLKESSNTAQSAGITAQSA